MEGRNRGTQVESVKDRYVTNQRLRASAHPHTIKVRTFFLLLTYLSLRFQSSAQWTVNVQPEFGFHLTLTIGRLASVASGIVCIQLSESQPVASCNYSPSVRCQGDSRPVNRTDLEPPGPITSKEKHNSQRVNNRAVRDEVVY